MKLLKLTQGKYSKVDNSIFSAARLMKWSAFKNGRNWYACSHPHKGPMIYLHHFVLNIVGKKIEVDHINGDGLDNRLCNLRKVTHRENMQNIHIHRKGHLVGTYFDLRDKHYGSRIRINGKTKYLGWFKTQEDAHRAYLFACAGYSDAPNRRLK